jgi:hypothetical protein
MYMRKHVRGPLEKKEANKKKDKKTNTIEAEVVTKNGEVKKGIPAVEVEEIKK